MNAADPFEAIVNEHYEPLYRFAMSLTRAESDAGDLTQHTFYIWATKGHQLRDRTKVKTWLFTAEGIVAIHFAGPTWESNSGSRVVGALPPLSVTVDTNAIPWLRLTALNPEGPG